MTTRPYADAADRYWSVGWANPIPVKGKWPPPNGYTGYGGATVSYPDLQAWKDGNEGAFNIALRLPGDVVGIDVDAHDGRVGAESLNRAEQRLGTLPLGPRSTSRSPWEPSAIRFYRVPPGTNLRGAEKRLRDAFGDHIDVIRRDHRYAVVWPSVHPETHGTYTWYSGTGEEIVPPRPADLPDLPAAWVEFLSAPAAAEPPVPPAGGGESPWDLPRQFTREQAVEFNRPHFEALRQAPEGTINNRLNAAAFVLGHFVPAFWSRDEAERWLMTALRETAYDGKTWRAETTIASGLDTPGWRAVLVESREPDQIRSDRITDLRPYLDGTYVAPEPSVGAMRDDTRQLLYPGRWHTMVGLTASGKSWFGLWHALEILRAGGAVAYLHFEESMPIGTLARLLKMSATREAIRDRFVWLDCSRRWETGDFTVVTAALDRQPDLVVLDGINAACAIHGWPVDKPEAIGAYRNAFVSPATRRGAAVLSLGHPPKGRDRQGERHGFGSTAWLDEVDGVAFRLEAAKAPIGRGRTGSSHLYSVKDRYGEVEAKGLLQEKREAGWYYQGSLHVDDARDSGVTVISLSVPTESGVHQIEVAADPRDELAARIVRYLRDEAPGHSYESNNELGVALRARDKFDKSLLAPALAYLDDTGQITRGPYVSKTAPRPGRLASLESEADADDDA